MDDLENRQYKLSRVFLSLVGLWPYEKSHSAHVKMVIFLLMFGLSLVWQVVNVVGAVEYNQNLLLNTLPCVTISCVSIFKWCTFWYHLKDVKKLIDMIRYNWRSLNNQNEHRIILKYADHGTFLTQLFTCSIFLSLCGYALYMFSWSNSSDVSSDKREVSVDLRIKMNYFTGGETYTYVTLLLVLIMFVFEASAILGAEGTTVLIGHHVCGLFHVVRYRVRCAFDDDSPNASIFETNRTACNKLINAVKLHKTTLEYCKFLGNTFGRSYFILLIMGVISLSLHLVCLSKAMVNLDEIKGMLLEMIVVLAHIVYLFLPNYMGQIIMDNSSKLFTDTYNTRWYATSVGTQKLLLFIMHHSLRNYTFLVGGLFTPCYEGFSTLIRMSFSYFVVIYSTEA